MLQQMANFLCSHCNDPRILNPGILTCRYDLFSLFLSDLQESFIESLVGFVCHKDSLKALEELPLERWAIIRNGLK